MNSQMNQLNVIIIKVKLRIKRYKLNVLLNCPNLIEHEMCQQMTMKIAREKKSN